MTDQATKLRAETEAYGSTRPAPWYFSAGVATLVIYAALLVALSIDVMLRVWTWRSRLEPGNLAALLFFEVSRSSVTIAASALVIFMLIRRREPRWRPLTLAIAFATIWHSKAFGFSGFAGAFQESLALWLRAHHTPAGLLIFVFGSPAWTLWASAASMLYFSCVFPRPLHSDDVISPTVADRAGLMRGAGVAGADIGALFRQLCSSALRRGWLRPVPIALVTLVWIALFHTFGSHTTVLALGGMVLCVAAGMIITNLRAGRMADVGVHDVTRWLSRSAVVGIAFFAASAASSMLLRSTPMAGVVLLGSAPIATVACLWIAVLRGGALPRAPQRESS